MRRIRYERVKGYRLPRYVVYDGLTALAHCATLQEALDCAADSILGHVEEEETES